VPVDLILFKELEIIGSVGMQAARYPAMLRMVVAGKIQPGKLVQGTVRIEEAGDVLAAMATSSPSGTRVINEW
jgi:D-arabinose 1-dehydrogenase-like Zn-dependent alcohol dehydrogenase